MGATALAVEDAMCAIHAIDREFMDAVAVKDAHRVAALYADDARIMMPGRPAVVGKLEVLEFWKAALSGLVEAVTLDTNKIEVSGNLAFCFGTNTILLRPADEPAREEIGKYVAVYRRGPDGRWRMVADSYSANG